MTRFDNSYARLPDRLFTRLTPEPVRDPQLILKNDALAQTLGVADWDAAHFSGNVIPEGAAPLAQAYAGHQFAGWVPRLGDGRAVLLGEVVTDAGRFDIQLKGAGRTPYSRNGDGRAWLGPVLREYLISEFMAACGVPTTRALAAVTTGERVQRGLAYPGAILTRVAASHIRVGTFQYLFARGDHEGLRALADHTRARHYPQSKSTLDMFAAMVRRQAELIARWMGLGFVHGVMNTDNMAVSGETIDYGPCAFIDRFSRGAVYSSIDRYGRYAYDQQASIAAWNLSVLAQSLWPLIEEESEDPNAALERLKAQIEGFDDIYAPLALREMLRKIGVSDIGDAQGDQKLVDGLLDMMEAQEVDFTNAFCALMDGTGSDLFSGAAWADWEAQWQLRLRGEDGVKARMAGANPRVIPRTHQIEKAIEAAVTGDYGPARRLARVLVTPFDLAEADRDLAAPPAAGEEVLQTFCGT
ncbi:protein adenylyltransferase SelO [Celeribacter arenosi]|uniref:Protein nucleotidyltransferase YdiU n=1 Tax=Celeribacter arenosi TaxID=792649 RepID=A0ABP7KFJ0_9RHOB